MLATQQTLEPQFRATPTPPPFEQGELIFHMGRLRRKDPVKDRNEGIANSADPKFETWPELGEWAIAQLAAAGKPFFARELEDYMGKPKYARAFAQVVAKARRQGKIRIVAWGRATGTDGTLAALWLGTETTLLTEELFKRPEIRAYFPVPEGVGLSAADIQHEFTEEDCAGLTEMHTHIAAHAAISRLIENRAYFSAETLAAMLVQAKHPPIVSRRAIGGVIRKALQAKELEVHDVLPSANALRNKGKVIIYRGAAQ